MTQAELFKDLDKHMQDRLRGIKLSESDVKLPESDIKLSESDIKQYINIAHLNITVMS